MFEWFKYNGSDDVLEKYVLNVGYLFNGIVKCIPDKCKPGKYMWSSEIWFLDQMISGQCGTLTRDEYMSWTENYIKECVSELNNVLQCPVGARIIKDLYDNKDEYFHFLSKSPGFSTLKTQI